MSKTDLAHTNGDNEITTAIENLTYAQLINTDGGDEILGRTILDKASLIGKPFVITGIRFNPSDMNDSDFVSLEVTTEDDVTGVINDGSTGIRRQVVKYLCVKGWIGVPQTGSDSQYDCPCDKWDYLTDDVDMAYSTTKIGSAIASVTHPVLVKAPRGLRVSSYDATDTRPAGTTYYLA